jgi:membrane-bound transcription factor site-1 protease
MLVDPEEEYSESEVKKLRDDVVNEGLGVFVVGDWYNVKQMEGEV